MNAIYAIIIIAILAFGGWFLFGDSLSQNGDEISEEQTEEVMENGAMEGDAMESEHEGDAMEDGTSMQVPAEGSEGVDEMVVEEDSEESDAMERNEVSFDLKGSNFKFDVTEIRVKEGDTVTINFEAAEGFHDWAIDQFEAKTEQVGPGTPTSVTFVAGTAGEFEFYCSVGNHRQLGMVGTLIVE